MINDSAYLHVVLKYTDLQTRSPLLMALQSRKQYDIVCTRNAFQLCSSHQHPHAVKNANAYFRLCSAFARPNGCASIRLQHLSHRSSMSEPVEELRCQFLGMSTI